jgi:hypothetical protein
VLSSSRALDGDVLVPVFTTMSPAMAWAVVPAHVGGVIDAVVALLAMAITPRRATSVDAVVCSPHVTETVWPFMTTGRGVNGHGEVALSSAAISRTAESADTAKT